MLKKTTPQQRLTSELNRSLRSSLQSDIENVKFRQHIKAILPMCSSLLDVWNFIEVRRNLGLLENEKVKRTADNIQFYICKIYDEQEKRAKAQRKSQSRVSNFYRLIEREEARRNMRPELQYLSFRSTAVAHRDG